MTRPGAMYLQARDSADFCRTLHAMAVKDECHRQAPVFASEADYHSRNAAEIRSQFAAAKKLGLGGSAGQLPRGYFSDAPCSAKATQGTAHA